MKALIHHNPACGTSRKTLEILRESGADVTVNHYLDNPPDRSELKRLYQRAGMTPRDSLRAKEPLAQQLGLTAAGVDDDAILDAMMAHPILINRPIVVTPLGVRLCRPSEAVLDILPDPQRGAFAKEDGERVVDEHGHRASGSAP